MNLVPWRKPRVEVVERSQQVLSLAEWAQALESFGFQGVGYQFGSSAEEVGGGYQGFARGAFKSDSVVFSCVDVRMKVFSEARFMFRRLRGGRPGELFGTRALERLNRPWPGGTTGDLLSRMLLCADIGGNAFVADQGDRLAWLRPDWTSILIGSSYGDESMSWDADAEVVGFLHQEGGPGSGRKPVVYAASEVAHFAPIPDPEMRFRGMSWLTPVIREVQADKVMTDHKIAYIERGATANGVLKMDINDLKQYTEWTEKFKADHEGAGKYTMMFLAAGMDYEVVGADLQQVDFKSVQGGGETRIAAAAGTPPIIVGLSEGLQGSSLNAGNYQAAKRRFSDGTMRPLWRNAAGSLARLVDVPGDAELWYDDRDIPFLQEDQKDAAEIRQADAQTVRTLVEAGYEPQSVIDAVTSDDFSRLVHTGRVSVQLQEPGANTQPQPTEPPRAADPFEEIERLLLHRATDESLAVEA